MVVQRWVVGAADFGKHGNGPLSRAGRQTRTTAGAERLAGRCAGFCIGAHGQRAGDEELYVGGGHAPGFEHLSPGLELKTMARAQYAAIGRPERSSAWPREST